MFTATAKTIKAEMIAQATQLKPEYQFFQTDNQHFNAVLTALVAKYAGIKLTKTQQLFRVCNELDKAAQKLAKNA